MKVERKEQYWEVIFDDETTKFYQGVICATGITWHLNLPEIAGKFDGEFIHSFQYKEDSIFRNKNVLIIGAGNSGCDIACDAARVANSAFISMRRGYYFLPKYTIGIPSDLFKDRFEFPNKYLDTKISEFLLNKVLVGNLENYGLPKPDHKLLESHPIMNSRLLHHLGHGDIIYKNNVTCFDGRKVLFEDGTTEEIDLVVAATGYKRSFPFLANNLLDKKEGKEIDLYLEIFSKKFDSLFFVGGIEVSSAVFGLFGLQGELISAYLKAQQKGHKTYQIFINDKQRKNINLRGQNKYVNSLRHQRYVDKKRYKSILNQQIKAFSQ